MGFWGSVSDGLAWAGEHCEAAGRGALNAVSGSAHLGDKFYDTMRQVVSDHIDGMAAAAHDQALAQATAHGTDALRAEMAAQQAISAKMGALTNPECLSDFAHTLGTAASCSVKTVETVASDAFDALKNLFTPNVLSSLTPLLIGVGVVGGAYLAVDMLSHHAPEKAAQPVRAH